MVLAPLSENRDLHFLTKPVLLCENVVYIFLMLEALCLLVPPGWMSEGMLALVVAPSCDQQQQSTVASMQTRKVSVHLHRMVLYIYNGFTCVHLNRLTDNHCLQFGRRNNVLPTRSDVMFSSQKWFPVKR